jgi:hypothetical protein
MRDVIIDRSGQLGLRRLTHNLLANCRGILHEIGLMLVLTDLLVWRIFTFVNFESHSKFYVNLRYALYYATSDNDDAVLSNLWCRL